MPAWAMISVGACRSTSRASPSAIGGKPRPPWIRIGTRRLCGEREDRLEPRVVRQESLCPRVELDPARTKLEAAFGLLDRGLVQVEPDERQQRSARAGRDRERAVVGGT